MNWFSKLFSSSRPVQPTPQAHRMTPGQAVANAPASNVELPVEPLQAEPTSVFVPWLMPSVPFSAAPMTAHEQRTLEILQAVLDLPELPDMLLPRAAELVPQLIALLRETQLPLQAVAQRVSKEPLLAAEVLRLASSPYYRAQGAVTDLEQGIRLIGSVGLQSSIARVVLKPIYRSTGGAAGSPYARAMAGLWEHSDALAQRMSTLSTSAGLDCFDGYLLGMLHDTGWKVTLASLDRAKFKLVEQPSGTFVTELAELVHRLFGLAAQRWSITPGFSALTADARQNGLANGQHPMATLLRQALPFCANRGGCASG